MQWKIAGLTDVGCVRDSNEDAIGWSEEQGWAVLADGMGGHQAGEVASQMAIEIVSEHLSQCQNSQRNEDGLAQAVQDANSQIFQRAQSDITKQGMGTTIVALCVNDDNVIAANVGDSRLYKYSQNQLTQLSSDHSLVQEMVDMGVMTPEEALTSTQRNIITRALGLGDEIKVDTWSWTLNDDELFLMCSDGITDVMVDSDIESLLAQENVLEEIPSLLVEQAKEKGGPDNISVVLMKFNNNA
jgi:protein phosphatase